MSPRRTLLAVVLALFTLGACATPGAVKSDLWTSLTPSEQTEADVLTGAIERIRQACLSQPDHETTHDPCTPPRVWIHGHVSPVYNQNTAIIEVPRVVLKPDPTLRAILSHEMSHAWFADARDHCQGEAQAFVCEKNANYHAVYVLMVGYGYDADTSVNAVWRLLVFKVRKGVKPSHGHPDNCAELHDFERRASAATTLYACDEKEAGR